MTTKPRGFATISPERRREIASMGGKACSTKFKIGDPRAAEAGRAGGLASSGKFRAGDARAAQARSKGGIAKAQGGGS